METKTIQDLLSVREFSRANPTFSEASLRWYIHNAEAYGITDAIVRVGSRVFIQAEKFFAALKQASLEKK